MIYLNVSLLDGKTMKLDKFLKQKHGRQAWLAKELNVTAGFINQITNGSRPIPARFGIAIERATKGEVTRKDMFSNWAEIWPELAD